MRQAARQQPQRRNRGQPQSQAIPVPVPAEALLVVPAVLAIAVVPVATANLAVRAVRAVLAVLAVLGLPTHTEPRQRFVLIQAVQIISHHRVIQTAVLYTQTSALNVENTLMRMRCSA